jgi:TusA-related sulfurtransferase
MELIRAIREAAAGDVISVWSADKGSKIDIPKWVEKAGHTLIGLESRDGYDEIVVQKTH